MEAIKLKTQVDNAGILKIQLPAEAQGVECEVIVLYEPRQKMTPREWETFINGMYGSLANDPIDAG
jgi:hypothetical protein